MTCLTYTLLVGLFLGLVGNTHCRSAVRRVSLAELEEGPIAPALIQAGIRAHLERPEEDLQPLAGGEPDEGSFDDDSRPLLSPSRPVPERPRSGPRRFWDAVGRGLAAPFRAVRRGWRRLRERVRRWREDRRQEKMNASLVGHRMQEKMNARFVVQVFLDNLARGVSRLASLSASLRSRLEGGESPATDEVRDLQESVLIARNLVRVLLREGDSLSRRHPESESEIRSAMRTAASTLASTEDLVPLNE